MPAETDADVASWYDGGTRLVPEASGREAGADLVPSGGIDLIGAAEMVPMNEWSVDEVCAFVRALEMPEGVVSAFRENAVDGDMLLTMSDEEFGQEIGMLMLQVRKLRREVDKLRPAKNPEV